MFQCLQSQKSSGSMLMTMVMCTSTGLLWLVPLATLFTGAIITDTWNSVRYELLPMHLSELSTDYRMSWVASRGLGDNWSQKMKKWKFNDHAVHRFCIFYCGLRAAVKPLQPGSTKISWIHAAASCVNRNALLTFLLLWCLSQRRKEIC